MKLSVLERLVVQNLIPSEANYTNLKLIRVAREALSFTDEELSALNMRKVGEGADQKIVWDNTVEEKEIHLGETVTGMIVKELKKLDDTGKLVPEQMSVYEKFMQ